jgi:hypothetical protein
MLGAVHEYRMLILEAHLRFARELHNRQAGHHPELARPTPEWARALGLRPEDLRTERGGGR